MKTYGHPRAIMFDLDGTLVDTMHRFADLAAELMARDFGLDVALARRRYLETSGIPFFQQLGVIVPDRAAGHDATASEFEQRKTAICVTEPLSADTRAALERLQARGLQLVVSSNTGQDFVDEFVTREGFAFDLALGFDAREGLAKGAPHVERTLEALSVERDELWFVGDSLKDGELAAACGVAFIGRTGTFARDAFTRTLGPVRVIDAIGELEAWLPS